MAGAADLRGDSDVTTEPGASEPGASEPGASEPGGSEPGGRRWVAPLVIVLTGLALSGVLPAAVRPLAELRRLRHVHRGVAGLSEVGRSVPPGVGRIRALLLLVLRCDISPHRPAADPVQRAHHRARHHRRVGRNPGGRGLADHEERDRDGPRRGRLVRHSDRGCGSRALASRIALRVGAFRPGVCARGAIPYDRRET